MYKPSKLSYRGTCVHTHTPTPSYQVQIILCYFWSFTPDTFPASGASYSSCHPCLFPFLLQLVQEACPEQWQQLSHALHLSALSSVLCSKTWQNTVPMFSLAVFFPLNVFYFSLHMLVLSLWLSVPWPRVLHIVSSISLRSASIAGILWMLLTGD